MPTQLYNARIAEIAKIDNFKSLRFLQYLGFAQARKR